jgi:predicted enzyme related to lactoylglutathione lyase
VVRVNDLEAVFDAVIKAGGIIARPIFSFPGGRRFHFIDPSGSELAVWSEA